MNKDVASKILGVLKRKTKLSSEWMRMERSAPPGVKVEIVGIKCGVQVEKVEQSVTPRLASMLAITLGWGSAPNTAGKPWQRRD